MTVLNPAQVIADVIDEIFDAFETKNWDLLSGHIDSTIEIDHTSLGAESPMLLDHDDAIDMWRSALHPGKQNFHELGRYRIAVGADRTATASFSCHAMNKLSEELGGGFWETWGTHHLELRQTPYRRWKVVTLRFEAFRSQGDDHVFNHSSDS